MSPPASYVSQRDQMNARMATEAPSEVLSGFVAVADQLDALDFAVRAPYDDVRKRSEAQRRCVGAIATV
jgi:hypothetical protein